MTLLRPYQTAGVNWLRDAMRRGVRRMLVVAPAGSGKGTLIAFMIASAVAKGKRVLFLVAGRQLVVEFSERLTDQYGVEHGVIMSGHWMSRPSCPVQVASIDTLAQHLKRGVPLPPADLVFVDEADLARAPRFELVLACYPNVFVIGQTATPWRLDGRGLGGWHADPEQSTGLFQESVTLATPRELIDAGWLVDYAIKVGVAVGTEGVALKGGDFDLDSLAEKLSGGDGKRIAGEVIQTWHDHANGKRTVLFTVSIARSKELTTLFNEQRHHGGPIAHAEHVDGSSQSRRERAAIFARVRTGETNVLCNVGVVTRGVDLPPLEVVQVERPTKSLSLWIQLVGRGFRRSPETGKLGLLIIDHGGNRQRLGLPDDPRDYSLTADLRKDRRDDDTEGNVGRCLQCLCFFSSFRKTCPQCGAARPAKPVGEALGAQLDIDSNVQWVDGKDMETKAASPKAKENTLRSLVTKERLRGWKPNAVGVQFKAIFGEWPHKQDLVAARRWVDQQSGVQMEHAA